MGKYWHKYLRWALLLAVVSIVSFLVFFPGRQEATWSEGDDIASDVADPVNSISIVFVRSDSPLDWSSPSRATATVLGNYLDWQAPAFSHPIGHSFVRIRCADRGGQQDRDVWAGVTGGGTRADLYRFFFGGEGFGLMSASFHGRMMSKGEILSERRYHRMSNRAQRIRVLVSQAACERVLKFHDEFVRAKLYLNFGLVKRPRWKEGAGCTTFVLSLLDVAGVKIPWAAWSTSVRIPKALVGAGNRTVGVFELLFSQAAERWASPTESAIVTTFVDVSTVEKWIRTLRAAGKSVTASSAFGVETTFDGEGLIVDAREVPTPTEPLFYR